MKQRLLDLALSRKQRTFAVHRGMFCGAKLRGTMRDNFHAVLGTYEVEVLDPYRRLSEGIKTFWDVGGSEGFYAGAVLANTPAEVFCFEPRSFLIPVIQANCSLNGSPDRFHIINKSVADKSDDEHVRLDDFLPRLVPPALVKVDVDGAESDVLRGAHGFLATSSVRWIVEVHAKDLETQVLASFHRYGYTTTIVGKAWWRALVREGRSAPHNQWIIAQRAEGACC